MRSAILHTRVQNLSWSHIRRILAVANPEAQNWYLKEASEESWSVRTLDRNISTQYYERRLASQRKGFAFVERQKHIVTDTADFYIDLVFYNFKMKSFVLFELKIHQLTHQDIGQLDMYVRMYDDLMRGEDDNPTVGVLLCTDTDKTIAKYSVLHESKQLFVAKYMPFMPSEEELKHEIEAQKEFFMQQHAIEQDKTGGK